MDPLWLAASKLHRYRLDECISICDELLSANPNDQAAWVLKCKATIKKSYIDDIELDDQGVAEMLLDENALAAVSRPGTSLSAPQTASKNNSFNQSMRPVSQSGRPLTGFARPSSSSSGSSNDVRAALQSSSNRRGGTARPMTTLGREVRLGTASLAASSTGALVDVDKINIKKYASRTGIAMVLTDYLLHVEHNVRKALEMCAEATKAADYKDWWWKNKLGKCYFKLGLYRDAEKQFRSSIKTQPMVNTYLELCNVYLRLDLPNTALDLLAEATGVFLNEPRLILGMARVHDMLNDQNKAIAHYKTVLALDATHVEAIACLGAHFFYSDQPEISVRYYRRLLQMGVNNTELWNNIGLCCFYSCQYDMALSCLTRALHLAEDEDMADVWYNIGHIGVALGDLGLAYQGFKVAVSIDPSHGEALNNLAVLENRRQKPEVAHSYFTNSIDVAPQLFEPLYNTALYHFRAGEFQDAYSYVNRALKIYPDHSDSLELVASLQTTFSLNM